MQDLQFDTAQLLQAASLAGINPADIPADKNPWTWKDGRAVPWQMAFRSINAATAQQAEVAHGPSISLALQAAMEGHAPWTNDLRSELAVKRPLELRAMATAAVDDAIAGIQEARAAEAARRAELTPLPEQLQRQLAESREAAARSIRLEAGLGATPESPSPGP